MKKEYIKPTSSVVELDYIGMLCNSTDTKPQKNIETSEPKTLPVNTVKDDDVWGDVL